MSLRALLISFIVEHRRSYIAGILILILTTAVSLSIPRILGKITDVLALGNVDATWVLGRVGLMMGLVVAAFCLRFAWRWLLIGNSRAVEVYLRDKLFGHLQKLSATFYSERKTGDLVAYAINDIQAIRKTFGPGFIQSIDGIVTGAISLAFMSRTINPLLTALAVLPIPPAVLLTMKLARPIRKRFRAVQEAYADISDKVQENLSGIRVVKAFAQEEEETTRFAHLSEKRMAAQLRLTRVSALLAPGVQLCFGFSFFVFIILGSALVREARISVGDFVAFNLYLLALMSPVVNVGRIMDFIQRGIASFRRLDALFAVPPGIAENGPPGESRHIHGKLEFRGVSLRYPGARMDALRDISITLERGATLGIIGATGSGKTSLANLILRLYEPSSGAILLDGTDIRNIPIDVLRERIGYVPQDNFLFSTTIKRNIEFFSREYSDEEVEEAARQSEIFDSIASFPDGFETIIGERGVTLSGGQKQRISIARALIKDPAILILDDSLSALDAKTEGDILRNIRGILEGRTGIIISHRVSTVARADRIILLSEGRIHEEGTHASLVARGGAYAALWKAQGTVSE